MDGADPRIDLAGRSTELPAYKIGKAIWDSSKGPSQNFTSSFCEDQKYAIGENQWAVPGSFLAMKRTKWKNQSVRNYTYATIRHKMAVCLDAEPTIRCEPMVEQITLEDRERVSTAVRHEAERLHWMEMCGDVMYDGATTGKGIVHLFPIKDEFTGLYDIGCELVDQNRFYPDPGVNRTRIRDCRAVTYEPELDMSDVRRIFPDTWQLVTPKTTTVGRLGSDHYTRTADEIVYGPGTGEVAITRDGILQTRKADVAFVFIKDLSILRDIQDVLLRGPIQGYQCMNCGSQFETDAALHDPTNPGRPACPDCETNNIQPIMLPPVVVQEERKTRAYPYGRLICLTDNALLYDGPSQYGLRGVFPFAEYTHYRVTRRFWGYGDVALLKKVQDNLNKNIAQAIDNLRLAGNAPLEVPAEVPAYRQLGNQPGDKVPVPAPFMGMARYLPTNSYNVQLHQILDAAMKADIQEVSGVSDVARGITPSAPTSGREVMARQDAASKGLGLHLKELNAFQSEFVNILYQMGRKFYADQPRAVQFTNELGEMDVRIEEWSTLPPEVFIRVSADIDKTEKDNLLGQNINQFVMAGGLDSPYADLLLRLIAKGDQSIVSEFVNRRQEIQGQMQAAAQAGGMGTGAPGAGPGVPPGAPPGAEQMAPEGVMNGAG